MSEQTAPPNSKPARQELSLTVELGLYIVVALLALAVRLFRLGLTPLSTNEAQLALAAWRGTLPPAGASPLLTWLNAILFTLTESNDALARLIPALVGSALVLMPFFLRHRIGRVGSLGSAILLAISPVAIMASRTASGDVIAAFVMLGLVVAAENYVRTERAAWLYTGAALLGVGLVSGRTIYSALVSLAIGAALIAALAPNEARAKWQLVRKTPGLTQRLLIVLVAVFLACATALAWQPRGLGAAADLLSAWLVDLVTGNTSWYWPLQVLGAYEPLVVVMGLLGLFITLQRGGRFSTFTLAWLVSALLLATLRAGRTNGDTLLVVIPLALVAGCAVEALADSLRTTHFSIEELVLTLILMPVIAYLVLGLAAFANNSLATASFASALNLGPAAALIQPFLSIALAIILIALFATLGGIEMAVRGATTAILVVLALVTWGAGWGAAQVHPADPREIIAGPETASLGVRDLTQDLATLSAEKTTDVTTLSLAVQSPSSGVLGWYLRNMPNAQFVSAIDASTAPAVFITTEALPALSSSYAGQQYTLEHEWRLEGKAVGDVLKWLMYRQADLATPTLQAVLWVKQGQ